MLQIFAITFGLLITNFAFATGDAKAGDQSPLIITFNNYLEEPYIFTKGGKAVGGIYWDLAQLISKQINRPIKFLNVPQRRAELFLADGRAHIELLANPAWLDNPDALQWTTNIYTDNDTLVQNTNNTFAVNSPDDLVNKRLGTLQGFIYEGLSEQPYRSLILRDDAKSFQKNFLRLERSRIEVLIAPRILVDYLLSTKFDRKNFHIVSTWNIPHHLYSAVSPHSPVTAEQLSEVYESLKENGYLEDVFEKYR